MKELTLRSTNVGQPVRWSVQDVGGDATRATDSRIVILVHGFNVSERDARKSYEAHERKLLAALGGTNGSRKIGAVYALHWPGDHPNGLLSIPTFSARISDAQLCGERLAGFLSSLRRDQQVVLVAHSLGGQLVLNALAWIREMTLSSSYSGPKVTHAFLLAPAVPVSMCILGQVWGHRFCEEHVFYSERDLVLRWLFGPGSNLYSPVNAPAVGRRGEPVAGRWTEAYQTWLGHNEYWESLDVASSIVRILTGRTAVKHLSGKQLPNHADSTAGAARRLGTRKLRKHRIGEK